MALVLGRATRLAPFVSIGDKTYEATIRLGVSTDTDDALGRPVGDPAASLPDDAALTSALAAFRGTFDQVPPLHSAKKVAGEKAYELARRRQAVVLRPVPVTVRRLEVLHRDGDRLALRVSASAGFYVRALARDLGRRLGCGAHLDALRRTRSGWFDLSRAMPLAEAERLGRDLANGLISPADALPDFPSVEVNEPGRKRVAHGNWLGPEHLVQGLPSLTNAAGAPLPAVSRASHDALSPSRDASADRRSSGDGGWARRARRDESESSSAGAQLNESGAPIAARGEAAAGYRVRVLSSDGRLLAIAESRRGALHPVVVLG
jgi:tRNA pseudouridine55 synthase